jgi:hypothetical protein
MGKKEKEVVKWIEDSFEIGEFDVPVTSTAWQIIDNSFGATGSSIDEIPPVQIEQATHTLEEGEKLKWKEVEVSFGLDFIGKIPIPERPGVRSLILTSWWDFGSNLYP